MLHPHPAVLLIRFSLKKAGLLKDGEENDVDAVAAAKKKFQEKYKVSADDKGI